MSIDQINNYIDEINSIAVSHGWYEDRLSDSHYYMMIITEICEAIQADRRNSLAQMKSFSAFYHLKSDESFIFPDDLYNDNDKFVDAYNLYIEGTVDSEIADIFIRVLSFLGMHGFHLQSMKDIQIREDFFSKKTFTEICYNLTRFFALYIYDFGKEIELIDDLSQSLSFIYKWCEYLKIDLDSQIKLKVRYNSLRNKKHGKKY